MHIYTITHTHYYDSRKYGRPHILYTEIVGERERERETETERDREKWFITTPV